MIELESGLQGRGHDSYPAAESERRHVAPIHGVVCRILRQANNSSELRDAARRSGENFLNFIVHHHGSLRGRDNRIFSLISPRFHDMKQENV